MTDSALSVGTALVQAAESFRTRVYDDATGKEVVPGYTMVGHPTIAWGRALDVVGVTRDEGDILLKNSVQLALDDAVFAVSPAIWAKLDPVRAGALVDMAYTLGRGKLLGFHKMIAAIMIATQNGDWRAVHDAVLDSDWYRNEAPDRARRDATIYLTGALPQGIA